MLSVICIIPVLSLLPVRRRFYEFFSKLHYGLAVALVVLLWYHLPIRKNLQTVCLSAASACWIAHHVIWLSGLAWRNWISGNSYEYEIEHLDGSTGTYGATKITIKNGVWKFTPGQYVYIRVRSLGPQYWYGMLETHPYIIAWSERDRSTSSARKSVVLVAERHNGFSETLGIANIRRGFTGKIVVDGPYGNVPTLDKHDIAVFAANGIGVVAHLLTIRSLLRKYHSRESNIRRVFLVWILEAECRSLRNLTANHC